MKLPSGQSGQGPESPQGAAVVGASRLSDRLAEAPSLAFSDAFAQGDILRLGLLAALMIALHYKLLVVLVLSWGDPNWTHGYIIPLFSVYLLYTRRQELYEARCRDARMSVARVIALTLGMGLMLASLGAEWVAVFMVRNYWLAQVAMVGMLFGLVLFLGGWSVLKLAWLPVLFLLFALPIPTIMYERLSLPLQNLAASGSVIVMKLIGVEITSSASNLNFLSVSKKPQSLTVAEAWSGMRLLMAFVALGVATAYLDYKPVWQRLILVAAAVPIAVFCNVIRVTITC